MASRKRKATTTSSTNISPSNKMWSSSSSASAGRRKKSAAASTVSGGGSAGRSRGAGKSGWDESRANEMFDAIVEEDSPDTADMEGEFFLKPDLLSIQCASRLFSITHFNFCFLSSNLTTGISKLCTLLSLDPYEDIRVLVLLWKLGATKKPSEIQRDEFITGSCNMNFDSVEKLRELIPSLDTGFLDMEEFRDFYKFCFQFNRTGTHKTLDKDLVVALLKMTLSVDSPPRISPTRLSTFCEFLETNTDESYSKITLDQWRSFLDFSLEYKDDDGGFEGYDEGESAWPVLIDEYVEFMEKRNGTKKK
eukprot:CCRYP_017120-RA/>CCRYP_017120-RA protein AED:0.00 eAED:0.00 QI:148/1/1/1/1/1/2/1521/306